MKSSISEKNKSVVLLFGPTGVGKTDLLLNIFSNKAEIISADSMQVYQWMDIGTAKPSQQERAVFDHHLIDIITPDQKFHAGEFVLKTDVLIESILNRGNLPILSGGTGYYFRNFLFGLPGVPPSDEVISKRLNAELKAGAREVLYKRLQDVDPVYASKIHINDSYRLVRSLEVYESSGRPLSSFTVSNELRKGISPIIIGLQRDREQLYNRINLRVDKMFSMGLADEIKMLIEKGYDRFSPGMKGIGYREFFEAEDAGYAGDLGWIAQRIKLNSRHYAKKQITYFKLIPNVHWVDADDFQAVEALVSNRI